MRLRPDLFSKTVLTNLKSRQNQERVVAASRVPIVRQELAIAKRGENRS
jgi:hypothetical protein